MRNILAIFRADMRGLFTNFFALVVALGLCVLPALYAWFNIYANWDPYSNTGNLAIAVANEDTAYTDEDGTVWNMGENVVESLKQKTSIGWVFLSSGEEAQAGVESGKYYAAVVLDSDFSSSIATGLTGGAQNCQLTYYVNDKKNAVAVKITDTAVASVQESINEEYAQILYTRFLSKMQDLAGEFDLTGTADGIVDQLSQLSTNLKDCRDMITSLKQSNALLQNTLTGASGTLEDGKTQIDSGAAKLSEASGKLADAQTLLKNYQAGVDSSLAGLQSELDSLAGRISSAELNSDVESLQDEVDGILSDTDLLTTHMASLAAALAGLDVSDGSAEQAAADLESARALLVQAVSDSGLRVDASAVPQAADAVHRQLAGLSGAVSSVRSSLSGTVIPEINTMLSGLQDMLSSACSMMDRLSEALTAVNSTLGSLSGTISTADHSLDTLVALLDTAASKLDSWAEEYRNSSVTEQLEMLTGLLGGDADALGNFLASRFTVEEHDIYEISNYGSGVAPFYSTLAIWVGMTILVSLVKVHARQDNLVEPRPYQMFLGRYLLFFLLSQLQALIIVLGDLLIFHVQCLHPFLFWLAAAVASLTFSLFIYSFTISFGDIGKALAVVIMVIQIAGSGGTYPIEALPDFFQNVYRFFPFPYIIDAMRECIGGMYGNTYARCLGIMALFCAFSLGVGLILRVPMIGLNRFVEKRLEDTQLM